MSTSAQPTAARRKVALLIETSNRYGRDLLHGVHDWTLQSGERWAVRFTEQARRAPVPRWLQDWQGDGIIARVDSPAIATALRCTGRPVVDVSAERYASEFPRVSIDNTAVARLAAEHLLGKGYAHLAFCGDAQFAWSRERGQQFRRILAAQGHRCVCWEPPRDAGGPGSDTELRTIAAWLEGLPKPVGIFACYDGRAQQVIEACQLSGLAVPDTVAVLGVDDDEVRCELCTPPLSSVLPNARRTGREAAELLAALMRGESVERRTRQVEPVRVVERQSTDLVSVADPKVAAAVRFIHEHATQGIDVGDVLRAVPMSRTLMERKFRSVLGQSPHQLIVQKRLERVRHLLAETDMPVAMVAELTGFESPSYLSVVFRREQGVSPLRWRMNAAGGRRAGAAL